MKNQINKKIRLLLISGGASFENTIFRIFGAIEEIDLTHIDSDKEAFKEDLRDKFDVLIMYNLNQNPDETIKKNLKILLKLEKG